LEIYFVWICKGDLNKHYDNNRFPIQSFLFCIKAQENLFFLEIERIKLFFFKFYGVLFVKRSIEFICFNRIINFFNVIFKFSFFFYRNIKKKWNINNVNSYCSLKNNVLLLFIFRPFRTDNRIRSLRLTASGVLID